MKKKNECVLKKYVEALSLPSITDSIEDLKNELIRDLEIDMIRRELAKFLKEKGDADGKMGKK